MRLINNSTTRNLFESLNESYGCESYEQAAQEACEELFDAMTDDIFLNSVDVKKEDNTIKVTFNVSAYGGEPDENGNIEMNRDAVIEVPLDYTDDGENMTVNKFYETISELLKQWIIDHHDGPESFYEGVMINTGSTTVTSDETGVTIEDNGNTITSGNGVTVDIDNSDDLLPAEMDIAEPTEEIPTEEPADDVLDDVPTEDIENVEPVEEPIEEIPEESTEDEEDLDESTVNEAIDKDGGPFPYLMKHGQGPGTLPNDVKVVKYGESSNDKDIVYLDKVLTPEEEAKYDMKPMEKLEDCDTKPIKEADGYNQNQNVEIYQNPEFDYQILDITELDNIDSGDVRAIDMANILNNLDESLTESCGNPYYYDINSFQTRKGENRSTAIIELRLPKLTESSEEYHNVFFLEVSGDKKLKECIVRTSKNKIIKEYSGKSTNPVEHFKNVIIDIDRARRVNEAVEFMVNEPEKEDNINFADSKAIDKDNERQEKHLKQHADKNKESKNFKVEKEPDQDNTTGKTEEELTDTAEVDKLPKAKKTKVDAEKIKVKEIKEDVSIRGVDDEGNDYSYDKKITKPYYVNVIFHDTGAVMSTKEFDSAEEAKSWVEENKNTSKYDYSIYSSSDNELIDYINESVKLKEADELLDEPEITDGSDMRDGREDLEESGSDVAIFHRKPASVDAMRAAEQNGITVNKSNYKIVGTKELSGDEFNNFANHLSSGSYEWLKEYNDTSNSGEFKCVEVVNADDDSYTLLVDPQGYDYARYAAIKDNLSNEEELIEPEEELIEPEAE